MPNGPELDVLAPCPSAIVGLAIAAERGMKVSLFATDWEAIAHYLHAYNALAALLLEWEAAAKQWEAEWRPAGAYAAVFEELMIEARARLTVLTRIHRLIGGDSEC